MTRARLVTILLTLALAFAGTSAVLADSHEGDFDPETVPEFNQDEALILFQQLQERLVAMGVEEGQVGSAVGYLSTVFGNMSEADVEGLIASSMLAERSDADMGDDEFGDDEGDEPEMGDDEMGDDDEDEDE